MYKYKFILSRELSEQESGEIYKIFPDSSITCTDGVQCVDLDSESIESDIKALHAVTSAKVIKVESITLEKINKSLSM